MGINMESFKRKAKGTPKSTAKKAPKKPSGGGVNPADILGVGINIVSEVGNFYTTIKTEREKTEQARERTKQVEIESDSRLRELEVNLERDIARMNDSLERYKEDTKVKIKEIDDSTMVQIQHIETERIKIQNEHEARIHALKMQENTLNTMLEMYKIYFEKKINGEIVDFDFSEMKLCLKSLESSINTFRSPSNVIETSYVE